VEEHHFVFNSVLLITLIAFLVPLLLDRFRRIRIPFVVGEILAGVLVGKSGFNLIEVGPYLDFISTFGLTYLMFLSGLEIDFSLLREMGRRKTLDEHGPVRRLLQNPVAMGVSMFALTLVGAYGVSSVLAQLELIESPMLMTLIVSTTSLAVVVPVLKEHGITGSAYGQTILVATLIADFATMFLITVVVAFLEGGLTLDILLILVLFAAVFVFYRMGERMLPIMRQIGSVTA